MSSLINLMVSTKKNKQYVRAIKAASSMTMILLLVLQLVVVSINDVGHIVDASSSTANSFSSSSNNVRWAINTRGDFSLLVSGAFRAATTSMTTPPRKAFLPRSRISDTDNTRERSGRIISQSSSLEEWQVQTVLEDGPTVLIPRGGSSYNNDYNRNSDYYNSGGGGGGGYYDDNSNKDNNGSDYYGSGDGRYGGSDENKSNSKGNSNDRGYSYYDDFDDGGSYGSGQADDEFGRSDRGSPGGIYDDDDDSDRTPISARISSMMPNMIKTGNRQIGVPMLAVGMALTVLGMSLFFNKTLMRLGNLFFVGGVPMTLGPGRTAGYFFQPKKARATACLGSGILLVFFGWPMLGLALEIFGLLNLFGNMFPFAYAMLKQMPVIGPMLRGELGSGGPPGERGRDDGYDYPYDDDDGRDTSRRRDAYDDDDRYGSGGRGSGASPNRYDDYPDDDDYYGGQKYY